MKYWHVREERLDEGALIAPGRWGTLLVAAGQSDPLFFREYLLELWRTTQTNVHVSRLHCAFAYEDPDIASQHAEEETQYLYEVAPADQSELGFRADMLWLTWMGEAGSQYEQTVARCRGYWNGDSTGDASAAAHPAWEWLFKGGLRVVSHHDV